MSIYPIELSPKLEDLINRNQLNTTNLLVDSTPENTWIQAIVHLENNDKTKAKQLFEKIINLDSEFALSSQVELIILQPLAYVNGKILIKHLISKIKELPDQRLLARLLHALSIIMFWKSNTPLALKYIHQSRSIYLKLKEQSGLAIVLDTLGNISRTIADHQNALLYYSESLALKTSLNDKQGQAITLGNLGRLCLQLGRYQQARSFVGLDIGLCSNEDTETKSRLYNLLARIDIADKKFKNADMLLLKAVSILKPEQKDSLFFCLKDQIRLLIAQSKLDGLQTRIEELEQLLPENSSYHQTIFQFIKNQSNKEIFLIEANQLLDDIINLNFPELELDYRLWLIQLAHQEKDNRSNQQHLLLARKIAKKTGFKRFLPQIKSLMLQNNVKECINEETMRSISDDINQVNDGYLIRKRLGGGGYADVYLAHDMVNDRDVAIKCFRTDDVMDYNLQQNLWNQSRLEFEAVANINHPSIVKVLAIGNDNNGTPYLVQEFIPNGDLRTVMNQSRDLNTALTYLLPITRALAAIHEAGIIHRDIKPENILITTQGQPVLVDFGIALLKNNNTKNNKTQGTEHYMAPEQKLSTDIGHKVDLFSLGCILYEWLSGKPVEIQYKKTNRIKALISNNKQTVCEIDKDVCGKAYDLICQLLAIEPKDRPESASLVADEIKMLINEQ